MSAIPFWYVGDRDPSIAETITTDGTPVNLTGTTVRFKMRAVNSSTLKVNQPAIVVSAAAGTVRYDWAALDVDTAGTYLIWWEVTTTATSKVQEVSEALLEFREHGLSTAVYMEMEELKATLDLSGTQFADRDVRTALLAGSRGIDNVCDRRFYTNGSETRHFEAGRYDSHIDVGDIVTLTSLAVDSSGDGTYATTWVANTDFYLEPFNAALDGEPYTRISLRRQANRSFPSYARSIKVVGVFGWSAVPAGVREYTGILAAKLLIRKRQAPLGFVMNSESAVRLARIDPDFDLLVGPYVRTPLLV